MMYVGGILSLPVHMTAFSYLPKGTGWQRGITEIVKVSFQAAPSGFEPAHSIVSRAD